MDVQEIRRRNLVKVIEADFAGIQAHMADRIGRTPPTVSRVLAGKPIKDSIRDWERLLGYQPGALDREDFEPTEAFKVGANPVAIPGTSPISLYHPEEPLAECEFTVPAVNIRVGAGSRIVTDPVETEGVMRYSLAWARKYLLKPDRLVRYRVRGDSMDPIIKDGSWILVEMGDFPIRDGMPYLIRAGEDVQVKFLFKRPDGGVIIRSHNPANPDVILTGTERGNMDVLGRVVESVQMWVKPSGGNGQ